MAETTKQSNQQSLNFAERKLMAGHVFTPNAPIDERALFAGRNSQVVQIIDAVNQKGQHCILFGERGVGKTSLGNVLASYLQGQPVFAPRVNCDGADTFESVWIKILNQISLIQTTRGIGFNPSINKSQFNATDFLVKPVTSDGVRQAITKLATLALPILIVDEFDRLPKATRRAFADTIKSLSDHAVRSTIVLIGVADSVDQLIEEHHSIERALVQIQMPRMSVEEIALIVSTGVSRLGMSIDGAALVQIQDLSQGLPHYTHLICLHAAKHALSNSSSKISTEDIDHAVEKAMSGAQQSIRSAYEKAVRSARKDNLFADVLLSCALAPTNELGYFAAQDVRDPMKRVTGRKYEIPSFAQHLNDFADAKRGNILVKIGTSRLYRYRFANPLMQPFVIMQGMQCGKLKSQTTLASKA